ncbi:TonB-linked SusC/RagA family outer membrane protein [Parabacteroides sp. PF5-5]|uniref:SusC/RagA family TonB-linked outer membrane protein n=1 Tax=unclassified Parabacteroides TaxID=2649774 RepID=UPI002473A5DD|nr:MULTISPECIES: TonB-dependent receptor [unclassified Parabacteroides]MDH6305039.1 TonB-linked SusC/RagA family outer membrane protein [Parabacteroides sp. PH5-39]MDH6315876.1 TonB-linked SusC/RagA family outer membrane protein [Parabacteroides sp. PF5-13]MDH6319533.1 TonB-linked SusC/RagA family outer membrane protein [Parabacteroides sp. PH5-13]MDH6323264.1 TonB-linked SusC/RagA family outer membrane protein [Parabacteroides sp. PH5-8]MDH6327228.1 TonB-linked SusC/RagA family outer membrane
MRNLFTTLLLLCATFSVVAQNVQIKGVVVSGSDNFPLPGVNVVVKGTTNGTMTDMDGQFVLSAPAGSTLSITYVGFKPLELKADASRVMNISIHEDTELLDEVVVVGYGVQKKSVVTAAISSVKAEDLGKLTPNRIENILKGQVSGVQVTTLSGQPGTDAKVRIRGIGTVNNSDPLYIIDGMAVDGGIRNLNPADIESVEILKDAASAAVYGARAANGVVLVTTKSGKTGKARITYDFSYGLQNPWKKKTVLNAEQYMIYRNEMSLNGGGAMLYSQDQISAARNGQITSTDWQDEVFNDNAPIMNHQVNISGGSEKGSYYLSLGYFDQEGIIGGNYNVSNYDRWTIRSNNSYEVLNAQKERSFLNKVTVGSNLSYSRGKSTYVPGGANSEFGSVLGSALVISPLLGVYASEAEAAEILAAHPHAVTDKNGNVFSLSPSGFQEIVNPVALMNRPQRTKHNEDKIIGTFFAEVDIFEGLKFKSSYGVDLAFWGEDSYSFPFYLSQMNRLENSYDTSVSSQMNRGFTWQVENVFTYNKTINGKHNIGLMAGQSGRKNNTRQLQGTDYDMLSYDPYMATINSAIADRERERTSGYTNQSTFASYFGRVDYNFDERYMIQATVRRDGSDKFGSNNKWGTFPSVSAGWNVTNEAFMEGRPEWFNYMKLRGSWGINGNDKIDAFAYASLMDGGQNYYFGTGNSEYMQYGVSGGRLANPDLKWEESKQTDIGVDMRFFNHALTFTFDYFKKKTDGMLKLLPIPTYVGRSAPYTNAGKMENWGLEFDLGYRFNVSDFVFDIKGNASYAKTTLIDIGVPAGQEMTGGSGAAGVDDFIRSENGKDYPYFYGWKTDGILQTQAEADAYNAKYKTSAVPGDVRFKDLNDDDIIDDNDRTKIGRGVPDWTYGLTLNAEYKGFDLYMFFQGVLGVDIFDISQRADIAGANRPAWIMDRWTGPGTSDKLPRVTSVDTNRNWRASDIYVKNGNYVRLKNIQLGYTIPRNIINKAGIDNLRLFVGAENLLTFTGYKDGFDPEIGEGNFGVDKGNYPQARTITFGASISF